MSLNLIQFFYNRINPNLSSSLLTLGKKEKKIRILELVTLFNYLNIHKENNKIKANQLLLSNYNNRI